MRRFSNVEGWASSRSSLERRVGFALVVATSAMMMFVNTNTGAEKPTAARQNSGNGRQQIPFDVFFAKPLDLIGDSLSRDSQRPSVARNENSTSQPPEKPLTQPDKSVTENAHSHDTDENWRDLISLEELQSEIKTVRNDLGQFLANQGQFNKNFKLAAISGTELSVLAVIAPQLTGNFTWKDNAKYAREFGTELSGASSGLGRENFDKTKVAFIKLKMIFDGSIPADAGDVAETRPFHEFAPRKKLMRRIEAGKNLLKQNVNSEARFKSLADQIRHEAELIAALTAVMRSKGYEYTDETDFQNFAASLIEGAKEASESVSNESYDQFRTAIDKMNKSCTDCHGAYGNG